MTRPLSDKSRSTLGPGRRGGWTHKNKIFPTAPDLGEELGWTGGSVAEASDELAQVDDVLGSLAQRDDFRLARREGDALLAAGAPGERAALP